MIKLIPLPPMTDPQDFIVFLDATDPDWRGGLPMRIDIQDRKEAAKVASVLFDTVMSGKGTFENVVPLQDRRSHEFEDRSGYLKAAKFAFQIAPAYGDETGLQLYNIGVALIRAEADLLAESINGRREQRDPRTGRRIVISDAMRNPGDDAGLLAILAAKRDDRLKETLELDARARLLRAIDRRDPWSDKDLIAWLWEHYPEAIDDDAEKAAAEFAERVIGDIEDDPAFPLIVANLRSIIAEIEARAKQ